MDYHRRKQLYSRIIVFPLPLRRYDEDYYSLHLTFTIMATKKADPVVEATAPDLVVPTQEFTPIPKDVVVEKVQPETNYTDAILKIADANNIIKEKTVSINALAKQEAEMKADISRYETSRDEVRKEAQDSANELERIRLAISKTKESEEVNVNARIAELDAREADIKDRENKFQESLIEIERNRAEGQKIAEENAKAQADVDSKLDEAKRLSSQRKEETNALEAKRHEAEIAIKRMEEQATVVSQETAKYESVRADIQASEKNATTIHENIQKERQQAEREKLEARTENNSAEYNKGIAQQLIAAFRQALHTYAQINGTAIQIPELTDEHKVWIAEDLLRQVSENSPKE